MSKVKTPRSIAQATEMLVTYSELQVGIALVEQARSAEIARANANADEELAPLVAKLGAIRDAMEPWFLANRAELLPKGRKSLELGGCMIGSRTARARLGHGFDDDKAAAAALRGTRLASQTTRVSYSIDRAATLKILQSTGKSAETLSELGFRVEPAVETFFVERVEQAGTIA